MGPLSSSSLGDGKGVSSLVLRSAVRDPVGPLRRSASRGSRWMGPLSSSSLGDGKGVSSLVLRSAVRDPVGPLRRWHGR
jgi:hypothetical protein